MDKRAPGGLNLKKGGTEPQTSVSLWNQRKHSDYKLKKENNVTTRTKKNFKKAAEYKTDQALVFVNFYFLQKWQ